MRPGIKYIAIQRHAGKYPVKQMCEQLHRYSNLLSRDFTATRPNEKWVTDIFYIKMPQGTLYLSMIRDLFDQSIVAYQMGTEQSINLILNIIGWLEKKKRSLQSCNSTVTRGFNTSLMHIST